MIGLLSRPDESSGSLGLPAFDLIVPCSGGETMLVLSRKSGEGVRIGPNVVVTVLAVQENRVRLGIAAPTDISVRPVELTADTAVLPARRWWCM